MQARSIWLFNFSSVKEFDVTKLLVGDAEYADLSIFWQKGLDTLDVYFHVFLAGAVAHIYGKLEHGETVALKVFAEFSIGFFVLLGFGRKVEEHKYPHNTVFAEA